MFNGAIEIYITIKKIKEIKMLLWTIAALFMAGLFMYGAHLSNKIKK